MAGQAAFSSFFPQPANVESMMAAAFDQQQISPDQITFLHWLLVGYAVVGVAFREARQVLVDFLLGSRLMLQARASKPTTCAKAWPILNVCLSDTCVPEHLVQRHPPLHSAMGSFTQQDAIMQEQAASLTVVRRSFL